MIKLFTDQSEMSALPAGCSSMLLYKERRGNITDDSITLITVTTSLFFIYLIDLHFSGCKLTS